MVRSYFNGHMPVAMHDEKDLQTFHGGKAIEALDRALPRTLSEWERMHPIRQTSQFYVMGFVTQSGLTPVFGATPISVKRAVKKYREQGPADFLPRGACAVRRCCFPNGGDGRRASG
jgi:hypothetical protein